MLDIQTQYTYKLIVSMPRGSGKRHSHTRGWDMTKRSTPYPRRPTQADVARAAGVSQAMVSYVLNDTGTITVPDATRARILEMVTQLGYVPDRHAQILRTGKTYTIAC